jgi:23S rRNA maturation mini-RNase III
MSKDQNDRLEIDAMVRKNKQAQIMLAFLGCFDMAEPITKQEDNHAAYGRNSKIERTERYKHPPAPQADDMTRGKTEDAETKIKK